MTSYTGEVRYKRTADRDSFFKAIVASSKTFVRNVPDIYQKIEDVPNSTGVRSIKYREQARPVVNLTETNTGKTDPNYKYKVSGGDIINSTDGFGSFSAEITVPKNDDYVTWSWTAEAPVGRTVNRDYEYAFARIAYQTLAQIDEDLINNA